MRQPRTPAPDPASSRVAILLGTLLLLFMLTCCLVTLLGWTRGAFNALG